MTNKDVFHPRNDMQDAEEMNIDLFKMESQQQKRKKKKPAPKKRSRRKKSLPVVWESKESKMEREKINEVRRALGLYEFPAGGEPNKPKRDEILNSL